MFSVTESAAFFNLLLFFVADVKESRWGVGRKLEMFRRQKLKCTESIQMEQPPDIWFPLHLFDVVALVACVIISLENMANNFVNFNL